MRIASALAVSAVILAAVATIPASATHTPAPTDPVVDVRLDVLNYPDLSSAIDCDADPPAIFAFEVARIHGTATVPRRPSEHWSVRFEMFIDGRPNWNTIWHHQNAGPHAPPMFRFLQADQLNTDGALYEIVVTLEGDESGAKFVETCAWVADFEPRTRPGNR